MTSNKTVPTPDLHVQIGDLCDDGSNSGYRTTALAWMNALDAPWICALGNHDISNNAISPSAVAADYGMIAASFVYDLYYARIIVLAPEPFWDLVTYPYTIWHSQTTLDFLASSLSGAPVGVPCLIAAHAPLYNTVAGATETGYSSTDINFHAYGPNQTDDTQIRSVLDAHTNATAWIYGHTHSVIDASGLIGSVNVGGRSIAHIGCSAIHYTGTVGTGDANVDLRHKTFGQLYTCYVSVRSTALEVRYREHGAGAWHGPGGNRVTTFSI